MISIIKKSIKIKKFYQTELFGIVRKCKKYTVRLCYLRSKNCEHRKNLNLSKLYITLQNKWYFQKKNNIKLSTNWKYSEIDFKLVDNNYKLLDSKIIDDDINWFY